MDTPFVLTIFETCPALKLGRSNIYQLIKAGDLKVIKFSKATRLSFASVREQAERVASAEKHEDEGGEGGGAPQQRHTVIRERLRDSPPAPTRKPLINI